MGVGIGGDCPLSAVIPSEFASRRTRGRMMATVFSAQGWGNFGAYQFLIIDWLTDLSQPVLWLASFSLPTTILFIMMTLPTLTMSIIFGVSSSVSVLFPVVSHSTSVSPSRRPRVLLWISSTMSNKLLQT